MVTLNFLNVLSLGFKTPLSLGHGASGPTPLAIQEFGRLVHINGDTITASAAWLVPDATSPPP